LSVNSQMPVPGAFTFKPDGTKMYVGCASNRFIYEYSLSTAWALNTASYSSNSLYVGDHVTQPRGIFFKPDGTKMYATGPLTDIVWQYSTTSPFVVTLPASVENLPVEIVSYDATIAYTFFTADGGTTVKLINEEVL
ncbi:MAG: SMP-30/gluconolactonase/LRE family protein, partial [Gammaproteobacteria bacterium]|nr:SMP-30/gluconolactonase/LRE family protein [Gammaproteobacteria bacterium]